MAVYIVLTVIFLVFGIIFAFNKGDFLIAGLNTSESNQRRVSVPNQGTDYSTQN